MGAILRSSALICLIAWGTQLQAQTVVQPGQIAAVPRTETLRPASVTIASVPEKHESRTHRLWVGSMFALAGGSAFDAATSWGKYEKNSLLASQDGTFGAKGLGLKVGLAAAIITPQILLRNHPGIQAKFTFVNFASAGAFSAIAVHNMSVPVAKN